VAVIVTVYVPGLSGVNETVPAIFAVPQLPVAVTVSLNPFAFTLAVPVSIPVSDSVADTVEPEGPLVAIVNLFEVLNVAAPVNVNVEEVAVPVDVEDEGLLTATALTVNAAFATFELIKVIAVDANATSAIFVLIFEKVLFMIYSCPLGSMFIHGRINIVCIYHFYYTA